MTLAYVAGKPWASTRSCQIAIALRPRASAVAISSRYGSHALAAGLRPGRGRGGAAGEAGDTPTPLAGFDAGPPLESGDTSNARFCGLAHPPRGPGPTAPAPRRRVAR